MKTNSRVGFIQLIKHKIRKMGLNSTMFVYYGNCIQTVQHSTEIRGILILLTVETATEIPYPPGYTCPWG